MIRYDLRCGAGHGFDGWFRSSDDFDAQGARGLLSCPACGSAEVEKALMAPAVRLTSATPAETPAPAEETRPVALVDERETKLRSLLKELRAHVTANSEDVGDRFAEVARQMHAEEVEKRSVHGRASADDARALAEEGIEIHPLPGFPDDLN
ncbi:DUF1178 family protein [Chenggangzhangella methanolivorans]|uniref:DUF1178 family protein n=1 Tax=Chenggangzhangella methanolivorans TaxID=1437009 RepID=A0A9E6UPV8_9HYPH|nr:DUF1178 family protein [Chenggangzhangella methanolivorans]QZO01864.1 DUF1178 family protein [Chenggangzhangella methanolivorans]